MTTDADAIVMLDRLEWTGRLPEVWPGEPETPVKRALLARGLGWDGPPREGEEPENGDGQGLADGYGDADGSGDGDGDGWGSGSGRGSGYGSGWSQGHGAGVGAGYGAGCAFGLHADGRGEAVP